MKITAAISTYDDQFVLTPCIGITTDKYINTKEVIFSFAWLTFVYSIIFTKSINNDKKKNDKK